MAGSDNKIIGYTRSGKPIYEAYDHPSHEGFSENELGDAAHFHSIRYAEALKEAKRYDRASQEHKQAAERAKNHFRQFGNFYNRCRTLARSRIRK